MTTLVQKYGGTSVATPQHLLGVARRILEEKRLGRRMLVVVSAMGQTTDELLALARQVSPNPPRREMDMLLTAGERITMALLAMTLESLDVAAISFTGSQSGIITDDRHSDARIVEIRPFRIEEALEQERVVIVAGFQGVSVHKEITTLGRGGSDTSAVALAIRFGCPWCEIFTDVHGILTADPRIVPAARTLPRIGYEATIVLSHLGAQVLFRRSVILARKFGMPVRIRCSLSDGPETWIGPLPETTALGTARSVEASPKEAAPKEVSMMANQPRSDLPMESDRILSIALEARCVTVEVEGNAPADKLLAVLGEEGGAAPWTWVEAQVLQNRAVVRGVCPEPGPDESRLLARTRGFGGTVRVCRDLAVVSLVGEGILARPELLAQVHAHMTEAGISVHCARSSSLSLSFLIDAARAEEAVRLLHKRFVGTGDA